MNATHPGDAEAQAAIGAMNDHTPGWRFAPGMKVRCPRAFGGGHQLGTIARRETDRRLGTVYLVDTPEGRLVLLPDELEVVS